MRRILGVLSLALVLADVRVQRNRHGQLWLGMPAFSTQGGRGYEFCFLVLLSVVGTSAAQKVKHAPTVELCQADQRLWLSKLEDSKGSWRDPCCLQRANGMAARDVRV